MNKIIKSSLYGSLIITLLYLVLFYPLILIHKFDWYDLLLVSLSISPGILIMIFIYNLDEEDKEKVVDALNEYCNSNDIDIEIK